MITLGKRSKEMCIGHRLLNYNGKCAHVHGHGIIVELSFAIPRGYEHDGITIDFFDIAGFLDMIDSKFDHGFLVNGDDTEMLEFLIRQRSKHYVFKGNPTMENIAKEIYDIAVRTAEWYKMLRSVTVFEKGGQDNAAAYVREERQP